MKETGEEFDEAQWENDATVVAEFELLTYQPQAVLDYTSELKGLTVTLNEVLDNRELMKYLGTVEHDARILNFN